MKRHGNSKLLALAVTIFKLFTTAAIARSVSVGFRNGSCVGHGASEIKTLARWNAKRKRCDTVVVGNCKIAQKNNVHPYQQIDSRQVSLCNRYLLNDNIIRQANVNQKSWG